MSDPQLVGIECHDPGLLVACDRHSRIIHEMRLRVKAPGSIGSMGGSGANWV